MNSVSTPEIPSVFASTGDAREEFRALVSSCAFYRLSSRARLSVTGSDRVRWLNGMVTNNVRDLKIGRGVYSFLLNPQGRILGDLYIWNQGERLLVDTDKSQIQKMQETFAKFIIMDDVEIAADPTVTIEITGPSALATLQSAGFKVPQLESLHFAPIVYDTSLIVSRGDNPEVESYELWMEPASIEPAGGALREAGATPAGPAAVEWLRIASGVPRYGQDIGERDLPQETGQERALNYSKGCYIGQEIVERIRSRGNVHRMFAGFAIAGPLPLPRTKIQVEGKDVGEITSVASVPLGEDVRGVGLGYIRREIAATGNSLEFGASRLQIVKRPFVEFFKH